MGVCFIYVTNPLRDKYPRRAYNKVPYFVLLEYDRIQEGWQMDMFCCTMCLGRAKVAAMTISSVDGVETAKSVVDQQKEETKSPQDRFTPSGSRLLAVVTVEL